SEAFGFNTGVGKAVLYGLLAMMAALPIAWFLQGASAHVLSHFHISPQEQVAVEALRKADAWSFRVVLGIAAIVVAPLGEEILFRGILYPAIKQSGFPRLALWGTAVLFGIVHQNLLTL